MSVRSEVSPRPAPVAVHRGWWSRPALALALAAALALAGCGGEEEPQATATLTASPSEPASTASTSTATATTATDSTTTGTTGADTDTSSQGSSDLPGDAFDRAVADADYAVVGVAHDDTLNVRAIPGVEGEVVAELDPTASAMATGRGRLLDSSGAWYELEVAGTTGWANARYLALPGQVTDITSEVVEANDGQIPQHETMLQLGEAVAALRASEEPRSDVVVSVAPSVGDLGEITMDVIGLGDDAIFGERLHVFATPDAGGEGFGLKSVEMTLLCGRGVSDGLCA